MLESKAGRKDGFARMQWVGREVGFAFQSEDLHFVSQGYAVLVQSFVF